MNNQLQVSVCGNGGEMVDGKINTSISVNEKLWKEFSSIVAKKHGNRYISTILEELIRDYIKKNGGRE